MFYYLYFLGIFSVSLTFFIVLQTNMSVMVLSNDQHMRENMWLILRKLMTINNGNDVGGEKLLLLVEK